MPATGSRKDHVQANYFKVEIEGVEAGGFRKCSGMRSETEIYEYQEGGDNETVRKLLGPTKTTNLTFTKGWVNEHVLFDFREHVASSGDNKIKRRNGSIISIGDDGKELKRWNFSRAWPVRWEIGEMSGDGSQALCETLEIAYEKLTKG